MVLWLALATAVARADPQPRDLAASAPVVTADDQTTRIAVALSAPVGIDVYSLDAPPRIVVDLPLADWRVGPATASAAASATGSAAGAGLAAGVRFGLAAPGRSRLVADLSAPARVARAPMTPTADGAELTLALVAAPALDRVRVPDSRTSRSPDDARRLRVALDAGHGGADPGAVAGGMVEKDVTLAFAHILADALRQAGHGVAMTREGDDFVGLEARVARARAAGADVLLSLHADAAPQAHVAGASVYTLSPQAADAVIATLTTGESAGALALAAMFPGLESDLARVLAPAIRRRTAAASARLGEALVDGLAAQTPVLPGRPLRAAAFQVLRAPDVASALIELGFLSNAEDRARLADPAWRAAAAAAIVAALEAWADAAEPQAATQ